MKSVLVTEFDNLKLCFGKHLMAFEWSRPKMETTISTILATSAPPFGFIYVHLKELTPIFFGVRLWVIEQVSSKNL